MTNTTMMSRTITSLGVLVRYHRSEADSPATALEAMGYSTTQIRRGLVLVTGAIDELALLDGQIAALTERRRALVAEREDEDEFADRMGFEARMEGSF